MSGSNINSSQPGAIDIVNDLGSPWPQVRDDINAYSQLTANMGIVFQHWMCIPYVIGSSDDGGIRDYDEQKVELDNGLVYDNNFVYKYVGDVYGIFSSNSKDFKQLPAGYYTDSTAYVTFNKFYKESDKKVSLAEFDKLIPCVSADEFWTVNFQKMHHNPTGIDRLQFKATEIEIIMDSTGRIFNQGTDYCLENGYVKWLSSGNQPGIDNSTGKGRVIAVRYKYKPAYYVKNMIHDIRAHATIDPESGDVKVQRGPIMASIQLDWVFLDSLSDKDNAPDASLEAPRGNNTGPR
jgi:hypothetical protein